MSNSALFISVRFWGPYIPVMNISVIESRHCLTNENARLKTKTDHHWSLESRTPDTVFLSTSAFAVVIVNALVNTALYAQNIRSLSLRVHLVRV